MQGDLVLLADDMHELLVRAVGDHLPLSMMAMWLESSCRLLHVVGGVEDGHAAAG